MNKIPAFEYMLSKLLEKSEESIAPDDGEARRKITKEFNRFKALKLLFLVTAASENNEMYNTFFRKANGESDLAAYPQGPVCLEVYNNIKNGLQHFIISNENGLTIENDYQKPNDLPESDCEMIDTAINKLLAINPDILSYSSTQLIEITHKWDSWEVSIRTMTDNATDYPMMDVGIVREESKSSGFKSLYYL